MALTCELCGSTDFVKDNGLFVCQGCGTKYTLQEAQRQIAAQNQAAQAQVQAQQTQDALNAVLNAVAGVANAVMSNVTQAAPVLNNASDFAPSGFDVSSVGAREANNYACRARQMLLNEYKQLEHPTEAQQKRLVTRAQECLTILDDAAMLDPNNDLLSLLIYENCEEIVDSAKHTYHYIKDEEGNWKRKSLDYSVKVSIPGQRESFDSKIEAHRKVIEQRYLDAHPDEVFQREKLVAQAEEINGRLNELKNEKKSHGFFDFSGKREVKDRMKPVEDELRGVRGQISDLDRKVDKYVDQCLRELGQDHIRLDF